MQNIVEELRKALQDLGVKGSVAVEKYDPFAVRVFVNGKEFGIWDTVKKTFVD